MNWSGLRPSVAKASEQNCGCSRTGKNSRRSTRPRANGSGPTHSATRSASGHTTLRLRPHWSAQPWVTAWKYIAAAIAHMKRRRFGRPMRERAKEHIPSTNCDNGSESCKPHTKYFASLKVSGRHQIATRSQLPWRDNDRALNL